MYGLGCIEQALFPPLIWILLGLENMRTGILIRVQRYKNILGYANFEAQKVKFFDKNLHMLKKSITFAAQNVK